MCTAAQFTMSKTWKQPKYPSADGWIKKRYMITVKYYSEMKKNEGMPFATSQIELEIIILSEVSQKEKVKYHMILLIAEI